MGMQRSGNSYTAGSGLNAYTLDLEATKDQEFCSWTLGAACGLRYARVEQSYQSELRSATDVLLGRIDFAHSVAGVGPTVSLAAGKPLTKRLSLVGRARGSVLFGDGQSRLSAGEDLDLAAPMTTTRVTDRDDLLTIGEVQLALGWRAATCRSWQPFATVALEGQVWNGAGNASSEEGDLGFVGFNVGLGCDW